MEARSNLRYNREKVKSRARFKEIKKMEGFGGVETNRHRSIVTVKGHPYFLQSIFFICIIPSSLFRFRDTSRRRDRLLKKVARWPRSSIWLENCRVHVIFLKRLMIIFIGIIIRTKDNIKGRKKSFTRYYFGKIIRFCLWFILIDETQSFSLLYQKLTNCDKLKRHVSWKLVLRFLKWPWSD